MSGKTLGLRGRVAGWLLALLALQPVIGRADTVASLLGNFTINQYCGVKLGRPAVDVHYVVVFGQLPALRELHQADADGNGVTSQSERDAYVGTLVPALAEGLRLRVDGARVPLHATHWTSSLPTEQGGFSLRVDVDFRADLPVASLDHPERSLELSNDNYPGRIGWHEMVVEPEPGLAVYDTNAFDTSLTDGLSQALQALPEAGPLDERQVHLHFREGSPPPQAHLLGGRAPTTGIKTAASSSGEPSTGNWIERRTRQLVDDISSPTLEPRVALLALLGALLLGAVHALSPGHGKTIVGAYLIGSRGTARHAAFLGATVTVTHTAGVFVLGFATLYASRYVVPERLFPALSLISAVLVLGMGVTLLFQRIRSARAALALAKATEGAGAGLRFEALTPMPTVAAASKGYIYSPSSSIVDGTLHSHGGGPMHSHLPPGAAGEKITWRSLLTLGISGGLVPCPSAMVLLLAAVALNKTAYGMLLVVAFSVGLAVTLTLVGLAFLYARNRFSAPARSSRWRHVLPVLSAGTITVLGLLLCVGAVRTFN